jgi:hypothetical protein
VADPAAAVAAAAALGGPVALKLDAVGVPHKSDVDAVRLGLNRQAAIDAAANELFAVGRELAASGAVGVRGLLVQAMAGPGLELIAGLKRDPQFGPVVIVGLGGILTEVFDDVALGLAPLAAVDALVMLRTLRGSRLLDGVRGRSAIDRQSVAEIIVALGRLAQERPDVLAVDLNPVVASDGGAVAVDALVVLADPAHP